MLAVLSACSSDNKDDEAIPNSDPAVVVTLAPHPETKTALHQRANRSIAIRQYQHKSDGYHHHVEGKSWRSRK